VASPLRCMKCKNASETRNIRLFAAHQSLSAVVLYPHVKRRSQKNTNNLPRVNHSAPDIYKVTSVFRVVNYFVFIHAFFPHYGRTSRPSVREDWAMKDGCISQWQAHGSPSYSAFPLPPQILT